MAEPSDKSQAPPHPTKPGDPVDQRKTITATQLFEGQREVVIEHHGERYRLRITRRNKLILQK